MTLDKIGELWGVPRDKIRRMETQALRKLKDDNPDLAQYLVA